MYKARLLRYHHPDLALASKPCYRAGTKGSGMLCAMSSAKANVDRVGAVKTGDNLSLSHRMERGHRSVNEKDGQGMSFAPPAPKDGGP
jgi:hypothetical protein